jgi:hypothetical protein
MGERGCRNPQLMSTDELSAYGESCPDIGMNARDRIRDRNRLEVSEQVLDKRAAARALRALGAMDTVQQLTDCDDAVARPLSTSIVASMTRVRLRPPRWIARSSSPIAWSTALPRR